MNFNLDVPRLFKLLKPNFKGILKYTLAIMSLFILFMALIILNIYLYRMSFIHISCPIILSTLSAIFAIVTIIYFTGLNYEIIHNFIEEKELFMPTIKGRFKEFMTHGVQVFLFGILYCFIILAVFAILFEILILTRDFGFLVFAPYDLIQVINVALIPLVFILFAPFFMAYAYTFESKSFFDRNNFAILKNSYIEFIYSYVLSRVFVLIVTLLFTILSVLIIAVYAIITFGIVLVESSLLTGIVSSILLALIFAVGIFVAFLMNTLIMFFTYSLNAQCYNYGKYFFFKGETPRRTKLEVIVPLLLLVSLCFSSLYTSKIKNNFKNVMESSVSHVIQTLDKFVK